MALLTDFGSQTPGMRQHILGALLKRRDWTGQLLDQIEGRHIAPSEIGPLVAAQLLQNSDSQLAARAKSLLNPPSSAERQAALATYRQAALNAGDAVRGQPLFARHCATCHRIGEVGVNVAPDISDSRTKTREQLVVDILEPNRAIDNNFVAYTVETTEGTTLTGIITAETANSITLRQPENKQTTLLRSQIAQSSSTGRSLMPEGWERTLSPVELADLVAYIKNWRYLDGHIPLLMNDKPRKR